MLLMLLLAAPLASSFCLPPRGASTSPCSRYSGWAPFSGVAPPALTGHPIVVASQ
ncbi:hypothetical protein SEVIR_9G097901v4 [Setaria viridis]